MEHDVEYVLKHALDGVFIVRNDNKLLLFNRACEVLYGLSRQDVFDQAQMKLDEFKNKLKQVSDSETQTPYQEITSIRERMPMNKKDGEQTWVEIIFTPIFDKKNREIAYVMGVIRDVLEYKIIEEEKKQLLEELEETRKLLESDFDFSNIIGHSPKVIEALNLAASVAPQDTSVIIIGESGTGKELISKAIHFNSPRSKKPFIAINCSAFPETLIESELFGYEKGAFTGADSSKPGKIQLAEGGTLFLDEVTELTPSAQAKILRVLQEREFEPLGGVKTVKANIRVIAATNQDPKELVAQGDFREDLYFRLFVYPIYIPPLRERQEDFKILIEHFLKKLNRKLGKNKTSFSEEAVKVLQEYSWPGNIRELENVLERMIILSKNKVLSLDNVPEYLRKEPFNNPQISYLNNLPDGFEMDKYIAQLEEKLIQQALKKCENNKSKAAETLGISRSALRYKLSKIEH